MKTHSSQIEELELSGSIAEQYQGLLENAANEDDEHHQEADGHHQELLAELLDLGVVETVAKRYDPDILLFEDGSALDLNADEIAGVVLDQLAIRRLFKRDWSKTKPGMAEARRLHEATVD